MSTNFRTQRLPELRPATDPGNPIVLIRLLAQIAARQATGAPARRAA